VRQVLIVAYYFPPIGGIGSIRAASFAKFLPEFGWEATVLAPADTPHAADRSLDVGQVPVVRTRSLEFSRLGRRPAARGAAADMPAPRQPDARSVPSRWLRRVAKQVIFPDAQIGWYPAAAAGGMRLLRERPFDLIFSSAFPITSHLVARTLQRRSPVPWVAEFRDPWSDDPDFRFVSPAALRVEGAIARRAARVVVPTPGMVSYYSERWGTEVALIPNGHDLDEIPAARPPDHPTLTHIGTYYPGRQSFRALWAAIAQLKRDPSAELPRIRFVGELPQEVQAEVAEAGIGDLVEATGFLPHEQAMRLMASSSMLIASGFSGGDPVSRGVIPAKLFEYLASGLPILYVGDPADDAGALLERQPGCYVLEPTDVSGVHAALMSGLGAGGYERDVEEFSRRSRTRTLAEVFEQAVRASPTGSG
jgi:glycosyltransferase involved in cell wall biosynthesis